MDEIKTTNAPEEVVPYNVLNNAAIEEPIEAEISDEEQNFMKQLDEKYKDEQPETELVCAEADVIVDANGKRKIVESGTGVTDVNVDPDGAAIMEKMMHPEERESLIHEEISEEQLSNELKSTYDLSDEEVIAMAQILSRLQKGENFSIYNAMPPKMQNLVGSAMASNGIPSTMENRNIIAKSLIEDLLNDIKNDASFVEFNEALQEIAKIPSLMDFHAENCLETMEKKVPEAAEKLKETNPDVAASLLAVTESWKDSYNFFAQYKLLDNSERTRNRVTKDIENYNRFVRDFNYKSEKSTYIINDVDQITQVLCRIMPERDIDHIKAFTILFIKACDAYYPDRNIPAHVAYVYYSIKNIAALDFIEIDSALEFNQTLLANINKLLDYIGELDAANKERLTNDPRAQKRKGKKRNGRK